MNVYQRVSFNSTNFKLEKSIKAVRLVGIYIYHDPDEKTFKVSVSIEKRALTRYVIE